MVSFPNAKINIGLQIVAKRPDGFHNLLSCFYPVDWCDILEIVPSPTLSFTSTGITIPGSAEGNLCLKAYHLLQQDFGISPVHIHLHKVIPIGAGLGGGSADGAFTLKMLNELFALGLSTAQLENYARQLGSDCAFFIDNTPKFCLEKGDVFEPIAIDLSKKHFVLINPMIHISTAEAYSGVKPQTPVHDLRGALQQPINEWKTKINNDFETHLLPKYPAIAQLKAQLYDLGATYASMTGSGSTVYGIFDTPVDLGGRFQGLMVWGK